MTDAHFPGPDAGTATNSQGSYSGILGGAIGDPEHASGSVRFRRALMLAAMTMVVPGSAQVLHGNKRIGHIAIRTWLACLAGVVLLLLGMLVARETTLGFLTSAFVLSVGRWFLVALGFAWGALIIDAWRLGKPAQLRTGHRILATGLNGVLAVGIAAALLFASNMVAIQNQFIDSVFASGTVSKPHEGRYNILLLGGDSGAGRDGLRPDSLNLVSIDADTGKAVLIGLPRNLQDVQFAKGSVMDQQFPDGFDCDDCLLNGVYTWAMDHKNLFDEDEPGISATISAVEGISGLKVNYFALVNMKGFSKLVNAVGGVEVNVRERTAIGGIGSPIRGYIEPGLKKLTGDQALWYARSRVQDDDWHRMGRQKCVMNAMLQQISPKKVLLNLDKISDSAQAMLETNIPRQDLNTFVNLALKTKSQPVSTVSLVPPVIYTGNPDFPKVRQLITTAIEKSDGSYRAPAALEEANLPLASYHDVSVKKDPRAANQTDNLAATC